MKIKTNRRKINIKKDIVLINIKNNYICPECKIRKEQVIHFIHKSSTTYKRLVEMCLCEECILSTRQKILESKNKNLFYIIPVLNSMLKKIGKFEEKSFEQLESEFNIITDVSTI